MGALLLRGSGCVRAAAVLLCRGCSCVPALLLRFVSTIVSWTGTVRAFVCVYVFDGCDGPCPGFWAWSTVCKVALHWSVEEPYLHACSSFSLVQTSFMAAPQSALATLFQSAAGPLQPLGAFVR